MVRDDGSGMVPGTPSRPDRAGDEFDVFGGDARRAGTEQRIEPADRREDLAPHCQVCAVHRPRPKNVPGSMLAGVSTSRIDTFASVGS